MTADLNNDRFPVKFTKATDEAQKVDSLNIYISALILMACISLVDEVKISA